MSVKDDPRTPPPITSRSRALVLLIIAAAAFAVHARSLGYGFVFDEQILITTNPAVHDLSRLDQIFGEKFWPGPARGIYYRPLVTLSYAIGYAISGNSPWVHHLLNIIAHATTCVLAFFLILRLARDEWIARLAALIFAIHPVHTESVDWIPGRTDVIATMFVIGAWLMLLRARETANVRKRAAYYACSMLAFAAGLGAKEVAIVLPVLVLIHDFISSGRDALKDKKYEYAGMAAVALCFMIWRAHVLSGPGPLPALDPLSGLSIGQKISTIAMVFACSVRMVLLPGSWAIDFAYADSILNASTGIKIISIILVIALVAAVPLLAKKRPLAAFSIGAFIITILPVSHLAPFPTMFAERFLYLPSFFAALFVAVLIAPLANTNLRAWIVMGIFFLAMPSSTITRSSNFKNDLVFWRAAARQAPKLAAARNWLGIAYRDRGMLEEAEAQYRLAFKLDPGFSVARMNLSEILMRKGDMDGAIAMLEELVSTETTNPELRANLGIAYSRAGRWEKAKEQWEAALGVSPENFMAHLGLARYHLRVGKNKAKAKGHLLAAKKIQPNHPMVIKLEEEAGY